jgi:tRNA G46 methylase TrmB
LLRKDPDFYGKYDWTDTPRYLNTHSVNNLARNGYLWIIGDERRLFDHDEEKRKKEERAAKRKEAKEAKEVKKSKETVPKKKKEKKQTKKQKQKVMKCQSLFNRHLGS